MRQQREANHLSPTNVILNESHYNSGAANWHNTHGVYQV
jgi:hypothetical protein